MSALNAVVPIALSQTRTCNIVTKWALDNSEYNELAGSFRLLSNGEATFKAVHRAIETATKSVCIICWGFQPSMHFIRDGGASPSIGRLLEDKARNGVHIKILCYVLDPLHAGIGVTGMAGEANTPSRRYTAIKDLPATGTPAQHREDGEWYLRYDRAQVVADALGKHAQGMNQRGRAPNLHFVGRGFSTMERATIGLQDFEDKGLGALTKAALATFPTHHQKMVLIDHEDPARCVGFVMGHNMLDEYWDTDAHSHRRLPHDRGRNGSRPRHDISSRVTGPITGDLFRNFALAWKKETGEALPIPAFEHYPVSRHDPVILGQILRTQPQYQVKDIKRAYLQAVNNASQFIYLENQYFRWPPLAEKIKDNAALYTDRGRTPERDNPLYLFVITNADTEGMGPGVVNTYRMLESLGRADTLPPVTRLERADDAEARLKRNRHETLLLREQQAGLGLVANVSPNGPEAKQHAANQIRLEALAAEQKALTEALRQAQDKESVVLPEEQPGLKVHVCTLVAPDSPGRTGRTAVSTRVTNADGTRSERALTREERIPLAEAQLKTAEQALRQLLMEKASLDRGVREPQSPRYTTLEAKLASARATHDAARQELDALKDGSHPLEWVDVYIHAKLMIIDDVFMTLGSTNINTRSMEVDSELNIAHHRPEITRPERLRLWGLHTNGRGAQMKAKDAYDAWADITTRNRDRRAKGLPPIASLIEFYSGTTDRTNKD